MFNIQTVCNGFDLLRVAFGVELEYFKKQTNKQIK